MDLSFMLMALGAFLLNSVVTKWASICFSCVWLHHGHCLAADKGPPNAWESFY